MTSTSSDTTTRRHGEIVRWWRLLALAAICMGLLAISATRARADNSCREWTQEHWQIKSQIVRLYLSKAPQDALDAAVFELLQREAYMTSCDAREVVARSHQLGWRMLDRDADEYGAIVIESLLVEAGLDLTLGGLFEVADLEMQPRSLTQSTTRRTAPEPLAAPGAIDPLGSLDADPLRSLRCAG